jgi:hypothetical protein
MIWIKMRCRTLCMLTLCDNSTRIVPFWAQWTTSSEILQLFSRTASCWHAQEFKGHRTRTRRVAGRIQHNQPDSPSFPVHWKPLFQQLPHGPLTWVGHGNHMPGPCSLSPHWAAWLNRLVGCCGMGISNPETKSLMVSTPTLVLVPILPTEFGGVCNSLQSKLSLTL